MADKDPELKCAAREYIEQIKNGTATDRDLWGMEYEEKLGCPVWKRFSDALTKHRVRQELERKARDDPTTQE